MHPAKEENAQIPPTPQNLLDRCLVDGDAAAISSGCRRRRKALGISFGIETVALALLIVVPILTSVAQPKLSQPTYIPFLFGSPHAHPIGDTKRSPSTSPLNHYKSIIQFNVGQILQHPVRMTPDTESAQTLSDVFPGPEQSNAGALDIGNILRLPLAPPPNEIRKPEEKRRARVVEGSVEQAQLISRIEPRYPPLAVQIRLEGTVVLHAIINREGSITALDVISGSPYFVKAALDAVRQWRYRPTLLNGEPVEVETTITVIFRLQP